MNLYGYDEDMLALLVHAYCLLRMTTLSTYGNIQSHSGGM